MTPPRFPEDWEILSAYLDGQLSSRELEKVQKRLETQPDLQRALDELQRTRMVLRAAPRRRAPRNFTLSPDMVPQRRPLFWLAPAFSVASALAVILLVATFAFSLIPGLNPTGQPAGPVPPTGFKNLTVESTQANDLSATQAPIIAWSNGGYGGGGGGPDVAPPGAGSSNPSTVVVGPTLEPNATPPAPELTVPQPPETSSTESGTPGLAPQPLRNAAPSSGSGPILGIRPTDEQGKIEITPPGDQTFSAASPTQTPARLPGFVQQNLTAIQVGLGLVAVGLALAAVFSRRRS